MPYISKKDLPKGVRDHLPSHAEEIYKEAYNSADEFYKEPLKRTKGGSRKETASKVAWSAVKKKYKKSGDKWVKK